MMGKVIISTVALMRMIKIKHIVKFTFASLHNYLLPLAVLLTLIESK